MQSSSCLPKHLQQQVVKLMYQDRILRYALSQKRARLDVEGNKDDDDDAEQEGEEEEEEEELLEKKLDEMVSVGFKFCDARADAEDELWIRALLSNGWMTRLVEGDEVKVRELAKAIAEQVEVGTFVKTEDDEDESICAFATVLDAHKFLTSNLREKLVAGFGESALKGSVGWVVRERLVNIPDSLTSPLFSCLKDDLEWAKKNSNTTYEKFLVFAPCYYSSTQESSPPSQGKNNAKKKTSVKESVEHALSEDMLFANSAVDVHTFHLKRPPPREGVDEPESISSSPWTCQAILLKRADFYSTIDSLSNM